VYVVGVAYKIALNDAAPQAFLLKHGLWGTTGRNYRSPFSIHMLPLSAVPAGVCLCAIGRQIHFAAFAGREPDLSKQANQL
jgi:hypothetical protein